MAAADPQALKNSFDKDGFVFIPGFLSVEELTEVKAKLTNYLKNRVRSMKPQHVFYEDSNDAATLKQLQDMNLYDPFFAGMLSGSRFEAIAATLLEEAVNGKTIEYFNKPPRIGKATPPHQDGFYFNLKPSRAVTMWLALEDADKENGCVRYIKGSHLQGMRPHGRTATLGFSQAIADYDEADMAAEIAFPAKPGDLLIHHSLTIHTAGANKTASRNRKALGFIYFAQSAKIDTKTMKVYQQELQKTADTRIK